MTSQLDAPCPSPSPKEALIDVTRSAGRRDLIAYEKTLRDLRRALYPHVRRTLRKYGSGNSDVDDIVQETLLAFHTYRDNLDPKAPVMAWLYAVARNKTIDATRRRNYWDRLLRQAALEPESIETDFVRDNGGLHALLSHLSDRERGILRCTSLEGRTVDEAARDFGVSRVHARVIKHRAIRKLSSMIGNQEAQARRGLSR